MTAPAGLGTAKLLVVDDQQPLRQVLGQMLERFGHQIVEAAGGQEAIRLYQEECPDAVLLDVGIPDMDGIAVLEELRRIDPNVRVAMLTGDRRMEVVRRALDLGARDYIVKPFYSERLRTAVERLLA